MKIDYRQGLISADPGFIKISDSGDKSVSIVVGDSPVVAAIADGESNYLLSENVPVAAAWGPFDNMLTNYLYWDIDTQSAKVTRGSTIFPIVKSDKPPATARKEQMWWNTTENKMYVYGGQGWKHVLRVLAGKFQSGKILTAEKLESQVGLNDPARAGYILFEDGNPVRNNAGDFLTSDATINMPNGPLEIQGSQITIVTQEDIAKSSVVCINQGYAKLATSKEDVPIALSAGAAHKDEAIKLLRAGEIVKDSAWSWKEEHFGKVLYCGKNGQLTLDKSDEFTNVKIAVIISTDTIVLVFDSETLISENLKQLNKLNAQDVIAGFSKVDAYTSKIDNLSKSVDDVSKALDEKASINHKHVVADVLDFEDKMKAKADVQHKHSYVDVEDLNVVLDKKAEVQHTHSLMSLDDVESKPVEDGQVLAFSAADNKWVPKTYSKQLLSKATSLHKLTQDDSGKIIDFYRESDGIIVLSNSLLPGFEVTLIQSGDGRIVFETEDGAVLHNRRSHTQSSGKWAVVKLIVRENTTGMSAEYVLSGDTI